MSMHMRRRNPATNRSDILGFMLFPSLIQVYFPFFLFEIIPLGRHGTADYVHEVPIESGRTHRQSGGVEIFYTLLGLYGHLAVYD